MPTYIDFHEKLPDMTPEQYQELFAAGKAKAESKAADEFGTKTLNAFFGTAGQAYCLSEAPDQAAVVKSHESVGIPRGVEDIVEVQSLV